MIKTLIDSNQKFHKHLVKSIHPSIFYTVLSVGRVAGGAGAHPGGHRAKGGI